METKNLTKNKLMQSIEGNLGNTINRQSILEEYLRFFELTSLFRLNISHIPLFDDERYYEIKDTENRILGQIFCSENQSILYLLVNSIELKITFDNKIENNSPLTIKKIRYNSLNIIDTEDEVLMKELSNLDEEFKPMFHLEINGSQYYADQVAETEEWIENDKYINTDATLYDYASDMIDCNYKSFSAHKYFSDNTKLVLKSADSLNGFATALKKGTSIPPITMRLTYDKFDNFVIKFNFEHFVNFHLKTSELNDSDFEEYMSDIFEQGEKVDDDTSILYSPIIN